MTDFAAILDRAQRMTEERLARSPDGGLYESVQRQLAFVERVFRSGRALTQAEIDAFTFGRFAAREFEELDRPYADALHLVSYEMKRYPTR